MWRVLLIFAVVLMVGDATGLIPEADEIACSDDFDGKGCPPSCPTCTCAFHSTQPAPVTRIALRPVALTARTLELPPMIDVIGLLAPAPGLRPPIA